MRLCQGADDREAGSYASNLRFRIIEEAVDKFRWYLHNHQAIYGKPSHREVRQVRADRDWPEYGEGTRLCQTRSPDLENPVSTLATSAPDDRI